ncbi:hypothetical protein LSTR_LSTR000094 [Laodelphax striatellus]|uniref:AAA+ ATPase domain-containing protein n=1 Tax=Laodelphax striatellus TaxID=195883 RepID=A0A482X7J0_LAOST|nr:hypothetical protein LSTR_LSTR000094 [Laodelphax striatellus]
MIKLRVQSIFLLFSIGFSRSPANPGTLAYSLGTLPEELKENGAPYSIDEREPGHKWVCQAESNYIQEQISITTRMLTDGEKVIQKQKDLANDKTILVLGKAGSGKTSLVQFLTENPKLQSKKLRPDTGEYVIEDGEKIGTSATESSTLYPELVKYNSSITFCDSPGFHDSRSSAHEIVSMEFLKSVISRFKKLKILLLENYSSLQYGLYKDNFINTLQYFNDFLVDIDRYKDNIVLIATKVPRTFFSTDDITDAITEVTEEMHIESIMEYLNHTETSLAEKINQKIGKSKRYFYQNVIKLLQCLQTRDDNGKATRVNVFRRPYKSGTLINMSLLKKNKESLTKTIMKLDFVQVKENDFDFTLSNEAKMYLECLLKLTNDNFKYKINGLSFKLSEFVTQKVQNYTSYHKVMSDFESFHNALKQLSESLDETKNYNEFFEKVNGFVYDHKISSQINYNEQIHVLEKYEEMLLKFVDTNLIFTPSSWTLPIRQVIKSAEEELHWYKSLNIFISRLESYKTQKNKTELYSAIFNENYTSTNELMNLFVSITGNTNLENFIDAQSNIKRKLELVSITNTLLQKNNITCDANGRLVVKGFHIRIAEINLENLVRSHCNNNTVKEVAFLAVGTVFLDEDTIDMFRGVNMFIAASKWEVIGQRRIVLNGKPGPAISDDKPYVANGRDGRPGLPGGNGGSFFGIGLQFLNGKSLSIESNGGNGGPGANGSKGARGLNGKDASEKLRMHRYNHSYEFQTGVRTSILSSALSALPAGKSPLIMQATDFERSIEKVSASLIIVTEYGDCGSNGAAGGFGGESGFGGLAGDQQLIELGDSSQIGMQNQNGSTGTRGSKGETGDQGKDGFGMICVRVSLKTVKSYETETRRYWNCISTNNTSPACNTCQKLNETFEYQYTTSGIEQPAPKQSPDFSYYLHDYTVLLESHTNHTIFNKIITDFRKAMQRKFSYTLNDLGLLFFNGDKNLS